MRYQFHKQENWDSKTQKSWWKQVSLDSKIIQKKTLYYLPFQHLLYEKTTFRFFSLFNQVGSLIKIYIVLNRSSLCVRLRMPISFSIATYLKKYMLKALIYGSSYFVNTTKIILEKYSEFTIYYISEKVSIYKHSGYALFWLSRG